MKVHIKPGAFLLFHTVPFVFASRFDLFTLFSRLPSCPQHCNGALSGRIAVA